MSYCQNIQGAQSREYNARKMYIIYHRTSAVCGNRIKGSDAAEVAVQTRRDKYLVTGGGEVCLHKGLSKPDPEPQE